MAIWEISVNIILTHSDTKLTKFIFRTCKYFSPLQSLCCLFTHSYHSFFDDFHCFVTCIHTFLHSFSLTFCLYPSFIHRITRLTHWDQAMHICISNETTLGSENGLSVPSHYLNQSQNIANLTLRNKLQWHFNLNSNIFIQHNAFEDVVCEMAIICLGLNVLIPATSHTQWALYKIPSNPWYKVHLGRQ